MPALSNDQLGELERLRARMGFISADSVTPRVIDDRYELERKLGSGGMGVVYLARDRSLDNTQVALKLVRESILREQPSACEALSREAEQMAKLRDHPNVVKVYDSGNAGSSTYLTMEYVEGLDLRRWRDNHKPEQGAILAAYLGAARGLLAAHSIGLIHRDFKPDNVLMDRHGTARVTDFGIATLLDDQLETHADLSLDRAPTSTRLGGTMAYIAPERLAGERADDRSDQFSFCVALWEALEGVLPYEWHDRDSQHLALSRSPAHPERLGSALVGRSLRRCLRKGMAVRREERHASMQSLIDALEHELGRPRRKQIALWTTGALALGVFGAVMIKPKAEPVYLPQPTCEYFVDDIDAHWDEQQRAALLERGASLGADPGDVKGVVEELDARARAWSRAARALCVGDQAPPPDDARRLCLERWLPVYASAVDLFVSRSDVNTLERAPEVFAHLGASEGDFCASAAEVPVAPEVAELARGARAAAWTEDRTRAEALSLEALALARELSGAAPYSVELAHAHAARAEVLHRREDYVRAVDEFDEAELQALAVHGDSTLLELYSGAAWSLAHQESAQSVQAGLGRLAKVEPLYFATDASPSAYTRTRALETRAFLERQQGHYEQSAALYKRAYGEAGQRVFAARALIGLANLEYERENYAMAEGALQRARALAAELSSGYGRVLGQSIAHDWALLDYEQAFDLEDDAQFERAIDDVLARLRGVADEASSILRLKALAASCQIHAETYRSEGMAELVAEARQAVAVELSPALSGVLRAQIEISAVLGLGDEIAEAEVRKLVASPELSPEVRAGLAQAWVEYLAEQQRRDELDEQLAVVCADAELMSMREFSKWVRERAGGFCH